MSQVAKPGTGGSGSGDVVGPGSSTPGDFAVFADGSGKLLADRPSPLDVQYGGTGNDDLPDHTILIGKGTSPFGSLSPGTNGALVQSLGASADPAYTTASYPSGIMAGEVLFGFNDNVIDGYFGGAGTVLGFDSTGYPGGNAPDSSNLALTSVLNDVPVWQPFSTIGKSSPTINMLNTGTTTIFTPTAAFIVTGVTFVGINITGTVTGATVSIGTNATDFNDIILSQTLSQPDTTGFYINQTSGSSGPGQQPIVSAGTPIVINITLGDATATTNTQRVDLIGYYV